MMENYIIGYKAFHNVTDQQKNNLACLQQHIPTALKKLQLGKDKPSFNILSIGAGNGFIDQEILRFVQEEYLNAEEVEILNTAVEPNTEFVDQYKESIERRSDKTNILSSKRSIKFDIKPMSFEEFAASSREHNEKYDMVHAIHSLYHMDLESTLKHCYYNELGEKGLIACLLTNDSGLPEVTNKILCQSRPGCKNNPWGNPASNFICFAENNSMKHESVDVPFSVDVTKIFDESSEEGGHLLDFFTHEDNYLHTADPNEIKEVLKMLEDLSTEDDNGRLIVNCTNQLVLIYKTP